MENVVCFREDAVIMISDGEYFSPDGGRFTVRGNILYWEDGGVTDLNENPNFYKGFRFLPVGLVGSINDGGILMAKMKGFV